MEACAPFRYPVAVLMYQTLNSQKRGYDQLLVYIVLCVMTYVHFGDGYSWGEVANLFQHVTAIDQSEVRYDP